jgi:hypothetical protein
METKTKMMKKHKFGLVAGALAFAFTSGLGAVGCSGGDLGGTGGTSGGGTGGSGSPGGSSGNLDAPCSVAMRVGGFSIQLIEMEGNQPYTSINGGVRNGVVPLDVWQQKGAEAGGCKLMVGPSLVCTTPCTSPQTCAGQNTCIDQPTLQSAGAVTLTGVGASALTVNPVQNFYSNSLTNPYPPFSPGAAVHLAAAGATIPAFSFDAVGIEPLAFAGTNLVMTNGQDFAFTWTPPAAPGSARIFVKAEIGHHGGVAAEIDCDLPDTGAGAIPSALVSALIAEGAHGFPTLSLTRRVVTSATVGAGCVDFALAAPVERVIGVCTSASTCITSCSTSADCASGKTCKDDFTCG